MGTARIRYLRCLCQPCPMHPLPPLPPPVPLQLPQRWYKFEHIEWSFWRAFFISSGRQGRTRVPRALDLAAGKQKGTGGGYRCYHLPFATPGRTPGHPQPVSSLLPPPSRNSWMSQSTVRDSSKKEKKEARSLVSLLSAPLALCRLAAGGC